MKTLIALAVLGLGATAYRALPGPSRAEEPHRWLQQLVGDWTSTSSATPPGAEPLRVEGTESVRSIGGLWTLAEATGSPGGKPVTSIMTLGYDPTREEFVGTWIDSVQTHLWTYRGTLDAAQRILTLETEGPSFDDPGKSARYRDVIELKSADHKVLTSSVQETGGGWLCFLRVEYRRKR